MKTLTVWNSGNVTEVDLPSDCRFPETFKLAIRPRPVPVITPGCKPLVHTHDAHLFILSDACAVYIEDFCSDGTCGTQTPEKTGSPQRT